MEKTEEQMYKQREEVLEGILAELKSRYEGNDEFSCVISVNDGIGVATLCYGTAINLICNVANIENNEGFSKVKRLKQTLDAFKEFKSEF